MNIELGKLKATLLEAAKACEDPVGIVEFNLTESAGVTEPHSKIILVKFWVDKGE